MNNIIAIINYKNLRKIKYLQIVYTLDNPLSIIEMRDYIDKFKFKNIKWVYRSKFGKNSMEFHYS